MDALGSNKATKSKSGKISKSYILTPPPGAFDLSKVWGINTKMNLQSKIGNCIITQISNVKAVTDDATSFMGLVAEKF